MTRKDLRQPDEFQTLTTGAVEWVRRNQSAVIGIVSALVAIAAIVLGVSWNAQRQATAASSRLQSAQALFDAKKYAEAAAEYASVAEAYASTPAGRLALLYRAHALAHQPDPAAAAAAYGEYLAGSPATVYLRQEALLGMGRAHEAAGNTSGAMDAYRQAVDVAGPFRTQARLSLARLEETAGNTAAAQALYAEVLKAPDLDGDTRQIITSRLPPGAAAAVEPAP